MGESLHGVPSGHLRDPGLPIADHRQHTVFLQTIPPLRVHGSSEGLL